jgi:thioredoxin reductase (NADPH)
MNTAKVGIIGSGPSGLTAAIYTARANLDTTVYLGNQPGGQLTTTTEIENFPGFPEGIMGPDLMENMQKQAQRFGATMEPSLVQKIEIGQYPDGKPKFTVQDTGKTSEFNAIIIASGASARYLGLPNEERFIGKGYHSCATCDGFFYRGKTIAVVGGGDSAMEEANFLTKFADKVYLIHRKDSFRASKIMQERALANPKIEVMWNTVITELKGEGKLSSVELEDTVTHAKRDMPLDGIFVAIGHIPNSNFAQGILTMDEAGYLIPKSKQIAKMVLEQGYEHPDMNLPQFPTMSDIPGIFIAGDVEDKMYRQAITAAGDGCRAAMDCEKWLESVE